MTVRGEISFSVAEAFDRVRADKVLHAECAGLSRAMVQRFFEAGRVWLGNTALTKSDKVRAGDVITYSNPPPQPLELKPADIPLDVLFEDEEIIVINKPAGMVVHPGSGTGNDTLVHALLHQCSGTLSGIGGIERPGIVHRLDKETSGAIVAAKTDRAHAYLSALFASRRIGKSYLAITVGVPATGFGEVEEPIGRHRTHRVKMAVRPDGRVARSDWTLKETVGRHHALLEVRIHTGRTHQIRVHLAHIGYPIAGDRVYGRRNASRPEYEVPRCMLHAHRLCLSHPIDRRDMEFEAPLPDDFLSVLAHMR